MKKISLLLACLLFTTQIVTISAMENPVEDLKTEIKEKIKNEVIRLDALIQYHNNLYRNKVKTVNLIPPKKMIAQIMKIIVEDLQFYINLFAKSQDPFCDCKITLSCAAKTIERYAHNYMTQESFNWLCGNCLKSLEIVKPLWK